MTTEEDLGSLMYLRIWHDNSGRFSKASWYLQKIVVEDVENGEKYVLLQMNGSFSKWKKNLN